MRSYMRANLKPQTSSPPSAFDTLIASALAYWDCQEASGNLVDGPGSADLSPVGSPGYRATGPTAWLPYAVDTSSGNNFSAASPAARVTIPFSIAAWVKPDVAPLGFVAIASRRFDATYEYQFRFSSSALSLLTTNGSVNASTSLVTDANWHFVGVSCDGANVGFYLDGTLEEKASTRTITNQDVAFKLASIGTLGSTDHALAGLMAGVGIWDSELSEADFDVLFAGP